MRIQPRQFGAVLGDAINTLARVWQPLLSTSLIIFIPLGVVTLIVFNMTGALEFLDVVINDPASLENISQEQFFELAGPFFWAAGIVLAIQALASLYVYLAAHSTVAAALAGEPMSGPHARREAAARFVPGLVAAFIVFVAIAVLFGAGLTIWLIPFVVVGTPNAASALVALILLVAVATPAIWLSVSFSMVTSIIAIERKGPVGALRRSFQLVRSRWWPTLGYLLLVGLIGSVAAQLIQILAIPLSVVGDATSGFTLASLFGVVFQGVLIAGIGAMYTVWYADLRARSEELTTDELRR
jgi:hypothetical protein